MPAQLYGGSGGGGVVPGAPTGGVDTRALMMAAAALQQRVGAGGGTGMYSAAGFGAAPTGSAPQGTSEVIRRAKRLYIGNVPAGAKADDLTRFFNEAVSRAHTPGDHVVGVNVVPDRKFAFLELRDLNGARVWGWEGGSQVCAPNPGVLSSPAPNRSFRRSPPTDTHAVANAVLGFDGVMYYGQTLRIRRPNDFVPSALQYIVSAPLLCPRVSHNLRRRLLGESYPASPIARPPPLLPVSLSLSPLQRHADWPAARVSAGPAGAVDGRCGLGGGGGVRLDHRARQRQQGVPGRAAHLFARRADCAARGGACVCVCICM